MKLLVFLILLYVLFHAMCLVVRIDLKRLISLPSEKYLKETIFDFEFHKNIFKNIIYIYGLLLGIWLSVAII
ncbi:hypothetical protein IGK61_003568 [Enterococcus sp. AZ063]